MVLKYSCILVFCLPVVDYIMTFMVTKLIPESNIKQKKREKNFTLIRLTINNPHFVARVVAQWCIPESG